MRYNTGGKSKRAVGSGFKGSMKSKKNRPASSRLRTMRPKARKLGRS